MEEYQKYIGKKYNYENKNILINKFKKIQGNLVVYTDVRTYVIKEFDINHFFEKLLPYKEQKKIIMDNKTTLTETSQYNLDKNNNDIEIILFNAIHRVNEDKSFVQQANAICNITTQLINIKKLELLVSKNKK